MSSTSKISVSDPATPSPQPRHERGRHRPEHAHTVNVGIFLARDRAEKAEAQR